MNEQVLKEKLKKLEALYARPGTEGERDAAGAAIERIMARLGDLRGKEPDAEFKFTFRDHWSRMLFVALCRRYGLKPFRYRRQRYTTVMVKVPSSFVDGTLWPEFEELDDALRSELHKVTEKIISSTVHPDVSDEDVVGEREGLPG